MTIIISVMGRKGGITKTTLAKNIADECSRQGLSTILVDADSQGNASGGVNVPEQDAFRALVLGEVEWNDAMFPIPASFTGDERDNLLIVPSYDGQVDIETMETSPTLIYNRMNQVRGFVDVVICDCSPALTNVHTGLFFASDYVLIPTTCEFDSVMSIERTIGYLLQVAEKDEYKSLPHADILGIVPNRLSADETFQQFNSRWLMNTYARFKVFQPIREKAVWRRASQLRMSIHALSLKGKYSERQDAHIAYKEFLPVANAVIEAAKAAV